MCNCYVYMMYMLMSIVIRVVIGLCTLRLPVIEIEIKIL